PDGSACAPHLRGGAHRKPQASAKANGSRIGLGADPAVNRTAQNYAGLPTASGMDSSFSAGRVEAHQTRTTPTKAAPALASCAFESPRMILGLRRINSTRNRASPLKIRYCPRMAPVARGLPPRRQSHQPITSPATISYNGVGCTRTMVGSIPFGKLMPQGSFVGSP